MAPVDDQEAIPDDARVGEDDGTSLESLILSMLHYWSLRNEPQNVINMVEKHFTQDQMYTAHCSLKPAKAVTKCVVSKNRPASKAQDESLYNYMSKLNNENKLPKLTVNSEDLGCCSEAGEPGDDHEEDAGLHQHQGAQGEPRRLSGGSGDSDEAGWSSSSDSH